MHQILKLEKVKSITCFSTATIYRLMKCGKFPKQIKLSERAAGWLEQDINEYIDLCKNNKGEAS
jgi:prophage regulatory protein